jgi:hypothetical protein
MRRSFIRTVGICAVAVLAILVIVARAQEPFDHVVQMNSVEKAMEAVRVINAAEYNYRTSNGRFGSWVAVYEFDWRDLNSFSSGLQPQRPVLTGKEELLTPGPGPEVIPGYRLTLLVAEDGTAYSISLHEMKANRCGLSIFSDQSGLIYQGTVVGCPQIVDEPHRSE